MSTERHGLSVELSLQGMAQVVTGINQLMELGRKLVSLDQALGVQKMVAWVNETIKAADEMGKMAQRVGIAVEPLSRLAHAASLSDISTAELETSLKHLNKTLAEAAANPMSEAGQALKTLGVAATDSTGRLRSADDVLLDVANRFADYADGANKSAMAMSLFGKSGTQMIPLLNQGKEAIVTTGKDIVGVTDEMARAAEEFEDNQKRLNTQFNEIAVTLAKALLPHLVELTNWMVNAQRESGLFSAIAGSLVETLKALTIGLYAIFTALKIVGRIIGDVAALWLRGLEHEVNAIIQLFHLWVEAIKGVGTSLGEMVGSVRTAAEAMGQFVKGDFTGAFETARKGALDFGTAFLGVSDSVAQAAVKSAGIIGDVFTDTWGDAKVIYKQASEDIANDLESLMSFTSLITEGGQLSPVPSARAGGQGQMPGMVSQETQAAIQKATELLRRMNAEALDGLAKAMALEDARFQKQMRDIDDLAAKGAQVDELRQAALLEHQVRTDQINEAFAEKKFAVEDSITANLVDNYTRQEQVIDAQYRKRLQEIKQLGLSDQERIRLTVMAEQAAARQRAQLNISILQNNAQLFGQMAALSAQFGAKAFGVTKALRIGEAVMNTATGAARALADWPWPYSAVVAGIVAAMGAVQVALIASQKYTGQAHSGLTSVPMTGSFVLEKGERVIKTDQNADLTEFLATGRTTQVNLVLDGRTLSRWMFDSTRDGRTQIAEAAIV